MTMQIKAPGGGMAACVILGDPRCPVCLHLWALETSLGCSGETAQGARCGCTAMFDSLKAQQAAFRTAREAGAAPPMNGAGNSGMKIRAVRHLYEKESPSSVTGMPAIKKGDLRSVKAVDVLPCCLAMKQAWTEGAVGFGEMDDCGLNKVDKACIYHCSPYPEGAVWNETPISYCPWCAAPIEINSLPS